MGLLDLFLGNRPKTPKDEPGKFAMINGRRAEFTPFGKELYQSELIRAAINARATHISKLRVDMLGSARPALKNKIKHAPNAFMTWSQFLYKLSSILDVHNTAFIVPVYDEYGEPSGIFTPVPHRCEVVQWDGVPYLRYEFSWHEKAAVELEYCGIMTKFQYKNDFFGEDNHALFPTMDLIHIQNQGIQDGVKSAASYRFMGRVNNFTKASDLANERKRFTEENFGKEASAGGLLLFPNTYTDLKQIEIKPWIIDDKQMEIIKSNVFEYFGVNEKILMNAAFGDEWSAFYEGCVEPFAIQLSEVLSKMFFTLREQSQGNAFMATANRLQYLSNADKLNVSSQMLDRGIFSLNDVREIWNLPPVEGGDARIIRGEYYSVDEKVEETE